MACQCEVEAVAVQVGASTGASWMGGIDNAVAFPHHPDEALLFRAFAARDARTDGIHPASITAPCPLPAEGRC